MLFRIFSLVPFKKYIAEIYSGILRVFKLQFGDTILSIGLFPVYFSIRLKNFRTVRQNLRVKIGIIPEIVGLMAHLFIALTMLGSTKVVQFLISILKSFYFLFLGTNRMVEFGQLNNFQVAGALSLVFFIIECIPYKDLSSGKLLRVVIVDILGMPLVFKYLQILLIILFMYLVLINII